MVLLDDVRVLDFSGEIAGPYCTKLLADAGADVVKVEPNEGDPLRYWTASGSDLAGKDAALFQYLNTSKRSIVGSHQSEEVRALLSETDLIIDDGRLELSAIEEIRRCCPRLSVVSITPFGRIGPWADRPATEFVLQAWCGSIASRGTDDREPFHAGGRLGEWIAGTFAAVAGMAALRGARRFGYGDLVDVSMLECMCIFMGGSTTLGVSMGMPQGSDPPRTLELPSIEPTADDYIGFCTITAQQFQDFLVMIERPDLLDDPDLTTFVGRQARREEFLGWVRSWTTKRPTAEVEELAAAMRIPVAPIGRPETVTEFAQFVERGVYVTNPSGRFRQPRPSYRVDQLEAPAFRPAPTLGEHTGRVAWSARVQPPGSGSPETELPLQGLRVIDFTAFWAGPVATLTLASLGAEVIKVESIQRPDGMRFSSAKGPGTESWWEWGSVYQGNNLSKLGVTLDVTKPEGRELVLELISKADALIENFSPRVLDNFDLTWDVVREVNPNLVMVRMPAFGLSGPWRDRTGFAQTMEQASGLAWVTGFPDGPPIIPRGPCDPLAGMHATFALLACLHDRERSGRGHFVEATMVEAALNVAAAIVVEYGAYGASLGRAGNRGPVAAPQGLYPCAGEENWLALAVVSDANWVALGSVLGDPEWARETALARVRGRREQHDLIDARLRAFFADKPIEDAVEKLLAIGIPAAAVVNPIDVADNPQMRSRGFIESFDHPIVGRHELVGMPFRFSSHEGPWFRTPSPVLGQHNHEVLQGLLGITDARYEELARAEVIGHRPVGA